MNNSQIISKFWNNLNKINNNQIEDSGYINFKKTINQNYYNFVPGGFKDRLFLSALRWWILHPTKDIFLSRIEDNCGLGIKERQFYKLFVSILYEYTKTKDKYNILTKLNEPFEGNPFKIKYKNQYISQDLCNSICEFNKVMKYCDLPKNPKILEIGAGYGRTAYVFLKEIENCEYNIIDIMPARGISEKYLSSVLPKSYVKFIDPNDIINVPDKYFDIILNISSFQEMTPDVIKYYFDEINRTCKFLYMKEWVTWNNTVDNIIMSYKDYPIYPLWERKYCKRHEIYSDFFEAIYKL